MLLKFSMLLTAGNLSAQGQDTAAMIRSSFVPPAYLLYTKSLEVMKPIMVGDPKLETHHRGEYLFLRAIAPPKRMTGIMVLGEDETGDTAVLQLYHQADEHTRPATDIVTKVQYLPSRSLSSK
jgi:hypothetical protein